MHASFRIMLAAALGGSTHLALAQQSSANTPAALPEVQVTGQNVTQEGSGLGFTPSRIVTGDELRNRSGQSIGETLGQEPGLWTSGFGSAAGRPVVRGLDGARVRILQNGMSVMDLSTLSPDHAVGLATGTTRQIEIVRGPRALMYGSGASGGTVNILNDRIPTELVGRPSGEAEVRFGSVDNSKSGALSVDGSAGKIGLHVDASGLNAGDYRIPGFRTLGDPASTHGSLPQSSSRQRTLGAGASWVDSWGYAGVSLSSFSNFYGAPTASGARIDLEQQRLDIDTLVRRPANGWESLRLRAGYTDYRHSELDASNTPETNFTNKAWETRVELRHQPLAGWRGGFGLQAEQGRFAARNAGTGAPDTVQPTRSTGLAVFLTEERDFGPVNVSAGLRMENMKRQPELLAERSFQLASASLSGLWQFVPGWAAGLTVSSTQRAPGTEELYSSGPHDATGTYDRGQAGLNKETARGMEVSLQKNQGPVRFKANLFRTKVANFIFGRFTGARLDEDGLAGGDLNERIFSQADATLHGGELEATWNYNGPGWSARGFADTTRGRFDNLGNLPLQPATRFGLETGYRRGPWQAGASALRVLSQQRIAALETPTPGYTRIDASLSYTGRAGRQQWTAFLLGRNLLNEDIRLSTSLLKDVAPQAGRNFIVGLRTRF